LAKTDTVPAPIRKPELGLPVLVHVMAPLLEELEEEKRRLPLDLVAVLDVRCGGNKTMERKLKVLNKAMGFIMKRLSHKDRLAIIPVRSTGTEPAAAAVAGLLHKNSAEREYSRIRSIIASASNTAPAAQQVRLLLLAERTTSFFCYSFDHCTTSVFQSIIQMADVYCIYTHDEFLIVVL
jgi:ribosomal protein S20